MAECASRLRLLSKALDVSDLRLDGTTGPWRQELVRLQGAGLGLDIKESLLEAWGLVLLANHQLDPKKSGEFVSQKDLPYLCTALKNVEYKIWVKSGVGGLKYFLGHFYGYI